MYKVYISNNLKKQIRFIIKILINYKNISFKYFIKIYIIIKY